MRIHRSATKHGVEEADILHAVDHALCEVELEGDRTLCLGPDRSANLLEIVVLDTDDGEIAIHAMRMRPQFAVFLPRNGSETDEEEID